MGEVTFIPAMIGQLKNMTYADKQWQGYYLDSFSTKAIDYIPNLLISAWWELDWQKAAVEELTYRGALRMRPGTVVMGDSGGFQAYKKGIALDVPKTLDWMTSTCDCGMAFDIPPDTYKDSSGRRRVSPMSVYKEKTAESLRNNEAAAKILSDMGKSDFPIYNVMHGATLEKRHYWYQHMKDLPFSRVASVIGNRASAIGQAFGLCHLLSEGYTNAVHVLGIGGFYVTPMLVYLADYFDEITFDSSSYGQCGIYRKYFWNERIMPLGRSQDNYSFQFQKQVVEQGLPCDCKICNLVNKHGVEVLWADGSIGGALVIAHNLRVTIDHLALYKSKYKELGREGYKNYLQRELPDSGSLALSLEFIDFFLENGIEAAYHKYYRPLGVNKFESVPITNSLFEE